MMERVILAGAKSAVANQIKNQEPQMFTYCYGHSLQVSVGDMVKRIKNINYVTNATSEISKLNAMLKT